MDDFRVLHEQRDHDPRQEEIEGGDQQDDTEGGLAGKADGLFHPVHVAAGVVVADQGHNALGDAHGHVHGDDVDLLGNAHGGHGGSAVGGCKIVQYGHAGDVEQVLDGGGDAHGEYAPHDTAAAPEFFGMDANIGMAPLHQEQHGEIQAGRHVGNAGGQAGARRPQV